MQKQHTKLVELTDRAAKNASIALTKLSGEEVKIEVSRIEVTKAGQPPVGLKLEATVAAVYLPVIGEVKGTFVLVFPEKTAYSLCDALLKRKHGTTTHLAEIDKSAIKEIGNILCGNFITVFANAMEKRIVEHVPEFSFDMFGAIMDAIVAKFVQSPGERLTIEIRFIFERAKISGYIILIFEVEEIKTLLSAIGIVE